MFKGQTLRALVSERLAAAAEDIFVLFERTMVEYEEELSRSKEETWRKRQLLDSALSPRIELVQGNVQTLSLCPGPGLNEEMTQTVQIKMEPEERSVKPEEEQLPGSLPDSSAVCVKTEESSFLQPRPSEPQEETAGEGSETERHTELSSDTDNDEDWTPVCLSKAEGHPGQSSDTDNDDDWRGPISFSSETEAYGRHKTGAKGKKHLCSFCHKTFRTKQNLERHIRVHTGEKPYRCALCKKNFNQKCNLEAHKRTHQDENTYCGAAHFSRRARSDRTLYSCPVCKKGFARKDHRDLHVKTHTGENCLLQQLLKT